MNVNISNQFFKRSTYVYTTICVYICVFLVFLFVGLSAENDMTKNTSPALTCFNKHMTIPDRFDLKNIVWNNEIYIIKNYIGVLSFGIYPLVLIIFNGSLFGMIVGRAISDYGIYFVFVHTFPHCFELVAIIMSAADSIFLGIIVCFKILGGYSQKINYLHYFRNYLIYSLIIFIAALCETTFSF